MHKHGTSNGHANITRKIIHDASTILALTQLSTMVHALHMALVLVIIASFLIAVSGWNEWDYNVQWAEDENKITALQNEWHSYWDLSQFKGNTNPPRARRGHSLHLIKTDERFTEYGGHTYIVLFGGRDNDQKATHIPKTYDVDSVGNMKMINI